MKKCDTVVFIGGDLRQIRAINKFSERGRKVSVFGFENNALNKFCDNVYFIKSMDEIKERGGVFVFPLPYTTDGENINMPFSQKKISTDEIMKCLPKESVILAGRCDEYINILAENYKHKLIDYFCREELQVLNAIPTAEGAIQIAMEETPHTLHNSKCLVIGNGRIGKILARMLWGIGAKVTISARKQKDLAQAFSFGYEDVPIWELYKHIGEYDVIFNTVPSMVLGMDLLSGLNKRCLIIDLASKPGGVDFDATRILGLKAIWALSLPGKVAPDTAGDIIENTILNILEEMEV